jgi:hypothetical protein
MDSKYLMGRNDPILRQKTDSIGNTELNSSLKKRLIRAAIKEGIQFYSNFFDIEKNSINEDDVYNNYLKKLNHANVLGLFQKGGIREKDHLNFYCLGQVLKPNTYIESGVFIGSSLHAYTQTDKIAKIVAIDPNLGKLKLPKEDLMNAKCIDDLDFSQIDFGSIPDNTLAYFDDHINSAHRIIQAHEKGIKYLLFDDSTGFEGICQRLYPAVPTIPMIMHHEILKEGDELNWTWVIKSTSQKNVNANFFSFKKTKHNPQETYKKLTLKLTTELLKSCSIAKDKIKRVQKIPDFGEFIPQALPEKMNDQSKYLVELI